MRIRSKHVILGLLTTAVVALPFGATASSGRMFSSNLRPIPHNTTADGGSNVSGSASIKRTGRILDVWLTATGLTPNEPHAMHIHGLFDRVNECPGAGADVNTGDPIDPTNADYPPGPGSDGLISLNEGAPFYGPIDVSFTETGSTAPGAGLNLEQFKSADSAGNLTYHRIITVSKQVAKNLDILHIVLHGTDLPADADSSSLTSVFEKTLPVACGEIH